MVEVAASKPRPPVVSFNFNEYLRILFSTLAAFFRVVPLGRAACWRLTSVPHSIDVRNLGDAVG